MKRIVVIFKYSLMIWGAVSLLGVIVFYGIVVYQLGTKTMRKVENDDPDLRFVLKWFGLSHEHQFNIEHSYYPTGSWSGDYMKAFAIKLVRIEESEIMQRHGVSRGDQLTPMIRNAVAFAITFTDENQVPWFPKKEQVFSSNYYIYPVRMVHQGVSPDAVRIMLIRPADKMVFYVAVKM